MDTHKKNTISILITILFVFVLVGVGCEQESSVSEKENQEVVSLEQGGEDIGESDGGSESLESESTDIVEKEADQQPKTSLIVNEELQSQIYPAGDTSGDYLIYKSGGWGFEFTYPSDYIVFSPKNHDDQYYEPGHIYLQEREVYEAVQRGLIMEAAPSIGFSTYENPEGLSPLEWAKENPMLSSYGLGPELGTQGEEKMIKVGGQDALLYSGKSQGAWDNILLLDDDKEYIYVFSVGYRDGEDEIRADFMKIIETVKFL